MGPCEIVHNTTSWAHVYLCTYHHDGPTWALPMHMSYCHVGSTEYIANACIMGSTAYMNVTGTTLGGQLT
jgi:hypothetical protein